MHFEPENKQKVNIKNTETFNDLVIASISGGSSSDDFSPLECFVSREV